MARVLVLFVHPAQHHSRANAEMARQARALDGITFVDLYGENPRHGIDADREQTRLLAHDIVVFQFPLFWYSSPSLLKEWMDLVLEHGFAYGHGGDRLAGKTLMLAITAAGPETAYQPDGYQHFPLRTFLTPFEQTARLCQMQFLPPYVLYGALKATEAGDLADHAQGYVRLLEGLRDDTLTAGSFGNADVVTAQSLRLPQEAVS